MLCCNSSLKKLRKNIHSYIIAVNLLSYSRLLNVCLPKNIHRTYIEHTYTGESAARIMWHITWEMCGFNMVINRETACFRHGNIVFPAQKHSVSIFSTIVEHIENHIDSKLFALKSVKKASNHVCLCRFKSKRTFSIFLIIRVLQRKCRNVCLFWKFSKRNLQGYVLSSLIS